MRKLLVSLAFLMMLTLAASLNAQQFDAAFGFGTVKAPAAANGFPSESGGLYVSFGGNVLLWMHHHLGLGGEIAPRVSQASYPTSFGNLGYRPIFFDFNGVYGGTWIKKKIGADVMAGIGAQDNRFYTGSYNCPAGGAFGCTNYQADKHFAGHFAADFRYYFYGHAFIRPEIHYYAVHNNLYFNNVNATRFAVSIGYSFLPGF